MDKILSVEIMDVHAAKPLDNTKLMCYNSEEESSTTRVISTRTPTSEW